MINQWILPILILTPFVGGLISFLLGKINSALPKWIGLITMMILLVMVIYLWHGFLNTDMYSIESMWFTQFSVPWIRGLNIYFDLGLDGLSLLMVTLTAFLGLYAVSTTWKEINKDTGAFILNLLWSLASVIGVFLAIDLFLFFFFWELMLVPIYFMVALWGHDNDNGVSRKRAALKFFIYTQMAGLILAVGIFALVLNNYQMNGVFSFYYEDLIASHFTNNVVGFIVMLCFFIGFAVKLPILPIHEWLSDMHAHAPTAGSVDIAGILIKTAPYGLIRFTLPFFPEYSQLFAPIAITIGVITLFYGAWLAFVQFDLKRLLSYTTVSHMGLLLIGIYAGSLISLQGVIVMIIAQGITSTALFIIAGQLFERYQTRDLSKLSGLWGNLRYLPAFTMLFCAALLGLPGTGDFIGEILVLFGSFGQWPWVTVIVSFSMVFAGIYTWIIVHRALFGPVQTSNVSDLVFREKLILGTLAIAIIVIGLFPQPIISASQLSVERISLFYNLMQGAL